MPRSESPLTPETQDELDRLDAAIAAVAEDPRAVVPGSTGTPDDDLDRELLQLAAAVRDIRPELDAGATMRLEERVQAAEAAPKKHAGLRLPADRRWRLGLALGAVVAVAVPVGAVVLGGPSSVNEVASMAQAPSGDATSALESSDRSSGGASATSGSAAVSPEPTPTATDTDEVLRALNGRALPPSATTAAPLSATRRVVRDVEQTVRVAPEDVTRAADRVTTVVADAGGYLDSSQVRERGSSAGGRFRIVVPVGRLDATIASLSRIGRPVRLERTARDVTDQATSLDDRLADLRADRAAARLQLARTVDPARRAARRRELTLLSSRVAALRGQVVDLRQQTATSRIDLRLTTSKASEDAAIPPPDDGSWGIGDAWRDAGRVLEVGGGVVLIGGVVLLPLLLVGGLVLGARRRGMVRRGEATIDAA